MIICCKNCGHKIKYSYSFYPAKSSVKIKCTKCKKIYMLNDINYNKYLYYLIMIFSMTILIAIILNNNTTIEFIIKVIIFGKLGDFIQYFFMVYSIKKHGFKE